MDAGSDRWFLDRWVEALQAGVVAWMRCQYCPPGQDGLSAVTEAFLDPASEDFQIWLSCLHRHRFNKYYLRRGRTPQDNILLQLLDWRNLDESLETWNRPVSSFSMYEPDMAIGSLLCPRCLRENSAVSPMILDVRGIEKGRTLLKLKCKRPGNYGPIHCAAALTDPQVPIGEAVMWADGDVSSLPKPFDPKDLLLEDESRFSRTMETINLRDKRPVQTAKALDRSEDTLTAEKLIEIARQMGLRVERPKPLEPEDGRPRRKLEF